METVLERKLATVPPALFHDDSSMRKAFKSDLAKKIEASCEEVHSLATGTTAAYISDGMALLQDIVFTTFDDLESGVMQYIESFLEGNLGVMAIAVGFDRYDHQQSIKQIQRQIFG